MPGFGTCDEGLPEPSPSSYLSASALPFPIGRSNQYAVENPVVSSTDDSYISPVQYAVSDPPASLTAELPNASTGYSSADTFYGFLGPAGFPSFPVNSSGHSGFSLFSDPSSDFNSISSSDHAVEYSSWNPLGTSFSDFVSCAQCSDQSTFNTVEAGTYYPSYVSPSTANQVVPSRASASSPLATFDVPPLNGPFLGEYYSNSTSLGDDGNSASRIWKMSDSEIATLKQHANPSYFMGGAPIDSSTRRNYGNQGTSASRTYEETVPKIGIHDKGKTFTSERTGQSDGRNFLENKPTFMLPTNSRKEIVCSTSVVPEHVWQQHLKPQTNQWDGQVGQSTSLWKWTSQLNSCQAGNESSSDFMKEPPSDCSDIPHMNFAHSGAANDASNINSFSPLLSSRGTVQFEIPQMYRQIGRSDQILAASSSTCNEELSSLKKLHNLVDDEVHGFQEPFGIPKSFKVGVNFDGPVQSDHQFSENSDQHNPAIDYPCWKGISFHNVSPFGASKVFGTQLIKETETYSSLNSQGPKISHLNSEYSTGESSKKTNKGAEFLETEHADKVIASVLNRDSMNEALPQKHQPCDKEKQDPYPLQKDLDCFMFSADNLKNRNRNCVPGQSLSGSGCDSALQQEGHGKGVLTTEKPNLSVDYVRDARRETIDGFKDCYFYHPFGSSEPVLSSASDHTMLEYFQELSKTMQSLSELIVVHYSGLTCAIKEEDINRLKEVISNIMICTQQESSTEPATSQRNQEVRENQNEKLQDLKKANEEDQLIDHHSKEEKENNVIFGLEDQKLCSVPVKCSNVDMEDVDKMTQAIKKVLIENFVEEETDTPSLLYMNSWLEAEAELCSLNFRARYNRIKVEMEKCHLIDNEDVSSVEKSLRTVVSPKSTADVDLSRAKVSADLNSENQMALETHANDVMTRFDILKFREDKSVYEEIPDLNLSIANPSEMACVTGSHPTLDITHCASSVRSKNFLDDNVQADLSDSEDTNASMSSSIVSSDTSKEHQMAEGTEFSPFSDASHHSLMSKETSSLQDNVMARLKILTSMHGGSVSKDIPNLKTQATGASQTHASHYSFPAMNTGSRPDDFLARILSSVSGDTPNAGQMLSSDLNKPDELEKILNNVDHFGSSIETTSKSVYDMLTKAQSFRRRLTATESTVMFDEKLSFADFSYLENAEELIPDSGSPRLDYADTGRSLENASHMSDMNPAFATLSPSSANDEYTPSPEDSQCKDDSGTNMLSQNSSGSDDSFLSDWVDLGEEEIPSQVV